MVYRTVVEEARFSRQDGLWHLRVKDLETGQTRARTCNILFACLGGLTVPQDPPFDPSAFKGDIFHTAQWPKEYDLAGKDVVVVGNGKWRTRASRSAVGQRDCSRCAPLCRLFGRAGGSFDLPHGEIGYAGRSVATSLHPASTSP